MAAIVRVSTQGGPHAGVSAVTLRRRAEKMLRHLGLDAVELSVALVDDPAIHALNLEYRHKDKPTDVLSFGQREGEAPLLPEGAPELLGDIVISIETATRQADARGATLDAELIHLAVHGLAHLCGYDHASPEEERVMFGWETLLREQATGRGAVKSVPAP